MLDFEELEAMTARVAHALPQDVLSDLQRAGFSLTLGSSSPGMAFRPVVVDPLLAEQIAERDLVEEMVSYRSDVTGVDNTVFISPKGHTQHAARVKVAINPTTSIDPRNGEVASVAIHDGSVAVGDVPPALLKQVRRFIDLNRAVLIDYWEYRIDTAELQRRLQSIAASAQPSGRPKPSA
jgi:hypothetical protein